MVDETMGLAQREHAYAGAVRLLQLGTRRATGERDGIQQDVSDHDSREGRNGVGDLSLEGKRLPDEALLHMRNTERVSVRLRVAMSDTYVELGGGLCS